MRNVREGLTGIKLEATQEPLMAQGGILAFLEYLKGRQISKKIETHSGPGFEPGI